MMTAYLLSDPMRDLVGDIPNILDSYCCVLSDVRDGKVRRGVTYAGTDADLREFQTEVLSDLVKDEHATVGDDGKYVLTPKGVKYVAGVLDE